MVDSERSKKSGNGSTLVRSGYAPRRPAQPIIDDDLGSACEAETMRILMLGWELPPRISGGLGRACGELLAHLGCCEPLHITFVLPELPCRNEAYPTYKGVEVIAMDLDEQACHFSFRHSRPLLPTASAYGANDACSTAYADACEKLVRKSRRHFDLIHAHDWLTFSAAVRIKERLNVPLVAHVHSTEHDRSATPDKNICRIEKLGIDSAQSVVAVSQYTRATVAEKYGCDSAKLEVIYNGATVGDTSVRREREQDEAKTVVFIGRLTYQKGAEYFVEAATEILQRFPATQFVVVGDGEEMAVLRSLVRALQLIQHFSFVGFLGFSEVRQVLESSDILVMPSISEPFGLVAIEAASIGIPTVISSNSGVAEILTSAPRIEPANSSAISRVVIELLSDRGVHAEVGRKVRAEAGTLSWEKTAFKVQSLYQRLLERK